MKPRILLMEDELNFRRTLAMNLELEGYAVSQAVSGKEALSMFNAQHFDLCILDVMVPEISGITVCEHIRLKEERVPVLFLSSLSATQEKINGLKIGADDYVAKPVHIEELLLKIQRLIRKGYWIEEGQKAEVNESNLYKFGNNSVNLSTFEAKGVIGNFNLTKKEADLIRFFFEHPNELLTRERILHSVWGYKVYPNSRSIDNFILFLRQKFEEDTRNPIFFRSVRGAGYRFTPKGY